MKNTILFFALLPLLITACDTMKKPEQKTDAGISADKMEWWREARFGMFIHWGLYAIPAGEWKGERIPGISEWIMLRAKIPVQEYKALAKQFNPVQYDADQWVRLAKEAGMKYIVITSKHHDGFAMFDSDADEFNIMDATPFGRDPLEELAVACRKHGVKLGFYHSQAQDWTHPGGTYRGIEQGEPHWDPNLKRVPLMQYVRDKAYPQVEELLTKYGDIAVMWWDTPIGMTVEAADTLHSLLALQPGILENNRLYRPWPGDFSTPEQHIPPTGLDYDWEVCMTMNTSWGYKWYDDNWKSTESLIRNLVDIASKGGNYLLNVGPTAEGLIPEPSVERLKAMGTWMQKNGESIYGTEASPFFKLFWGRCTRKQMENGTTSLYLHVFQWPEDGTLVVPGLRNTVSEVYFLADKKHLIHTRAGDELRIEIPQTAPDPINTVIVANIQGTPDVVSNMPNQKDDGSVYLPARMGFVHNPGYGEHALLSDLGPDGFLTNWVENRTRIEWMFEVNSPGDYNIRLAYRSSAPSLLQAKTGDSTISIDLPPGGAAEQGFNTVVAGPVHITSAGISTLVLQPAGNDWNPVELKSVEIEPAN